MLLPQVVAFLALMSLVSAAAFHRVRQVSPAELIPAQPACLAATIYSYITVTTTEYPDVVTVAVPDYTAISSSLASAATVNSLYVVEQSIDRPVLQPPDTRIPTFIESIMAPAVEVTEAPHIGTSVFYLPGTRPVSTIAIGATTQSVILNWHTGQTDSPIRAQATDSTVTNPGTMFTVPASGWNGTYSNATAVSPGTGLGGGRNPTSTVTAVTYVSTTTYVTNTVVTAAPSYGSALQPGDTVFGGYSNNIKRQTCVMISANINGHWVSWCNNWDGITTYTFTSWETTITPGVVESTNSAVSFISFSSITLTHSSTATVIITGWPATATKTFAQIPTVDASQTMPSASPTPSMPPPSCGETGSFNIGFDDLPKQSVFDNSTASLPPIFSPYQHFYWADGWSYLPPPNGPYPPHNGIQLGIYVPPVQSGTPANPDISYIPPGGFGAGARSTISAYWFNIQSAWVGCDNNATDPSGNCDFVAEGYRYDGQTNANRLVFTQHYSMPLCHSPSCQLQQIFFGPQASNLTTVGFYAKIGSGVHTFYMDDIQLAWSNNTCEAGSLRASSRK